jgi:choline transport protein
LIKSLKTILEMDDKVLDTVGDVELADQAGGPISNSDIRGNMTRDEGEMAYFGKKAQFKVRILNNPAAAMS